MADAGSAPASPGSVVAAACDPMHGVQAPDKPCSPSQPAELPRRASADRTSSPAPSADRVPSPDPGPPTIASPPPSPDVTSGGCAPPALQSSPAPGHSSTLPVAHSVLPAPINSQCDGTGHNLGVLHFLFEHESGIAFYGSDDQYRPHRYKSIPVTLKSPWNLQGVHKALSRAGQRKRKLIRKAWREAEKRDEPRRLIPPASVTTDELTEMLLRGESGAVIRQMANPLYVASTAVVLVDFVF